MGNSQSGENAVSINDVIEGTSQIPKKYFGGDLIQNDPSIQQMQQGLLAFDEAIKNILFRRNRKQSQVDTQSIPRFDNDNYLQPTFINHDDLSASVSTINKATWRCTYCEIENHTTEHACRRCGQAETQL